jgi:methyl-accepting chemotaxis protein
VGAVADSGAASLGSIVEGLERTVRFIEQISGDVERQAASLTAVRERVARIRAIAEASVARAGETETETGAQRAAMERLAATSQRTAETAATLDALAGRFRVEAAAGD